MAEYGRIVGQGTGVGGHSGGSGDVTGKIMAALGDIVDRIASQPPEILLGVAAVMIIGGWLLMRRWPTARPVRVQTRDASVLADRLHDLRL